MTQSLYKQAAPVVALSQLQTKQRLVDAIRMLERAGIIDHNGHCSARRDANTFYINSGASMRGSLTVEDIVAFRAGRPIRELEVP